MSLTIEEERARDYPNMSVPLFGLLKNSKVLPSFIKWCYNSNILQPMNLALMCKEEDHLDSKIFNHYKSVEGDILTSIEKQGPIRMAWHIARRALDSGKEISVVTSIDESRAATIASTWSALHHGVLPPERKVGELLLQKLLVVATSSPPEWYL